jgi:Zn-dependent protease with chaperone function
MSIQESVRFERISSKSYEHPADRAATAALRSVPLMEQVLKRLSDIGFERRLRQVLIGNAVQISGSQVPELWQRYVRSASVLDISPVPELFITQTPLANALTVGAKRPLVVVYSGLVRNYESPEVDAALAHELGHVLSEHYYYMTALQFLSMLLRVPGGAATTIVGIPLRAVYMVLLEWARAAELSSDRASAVVVGDPLATCRMLMRMAGGAVEGMNLEAFLAQAARYAEEEDVFARWSRAWVEASLAHPFAVKRTRELMEWVESGAYDRIRAGAYIRRGEEPPPGEELDGAVAHYRQRFVRVLETAAGGVDRVLRRVEDWLRPHPEGERTGEDL